MTLVYDIEGDGLYNEITEVHCIRAYDIDTGIMYRYDKDHEPLFRGIKLLNEASSLIGHNIIGFDNPALHKLYPKFNLKENNKKSFDTIIASKLVCTNLNVTDMGRIASGKLPSELKENHGLKAWGYRLGEFKGEYGAKIKGESEEEYKERVWKHYNKEMADYCEQDVLVNVKLYNYLRSEMIKRETPQRAIDIEHKFAIILSRQERLGAYFDLDKALNLEKELRLKASEALDILRENYKPKWFQITPEKSSRKTIWVEGVKYENVKEYKSNRRAKVIDPNTGKEVMTTNVIKGALCTQIELKEFNPNSGSHIIRWLQEEFGWKPSEYTDKGSPKTDGDTLASLTFEGIEYLQQYQLLIKRLSQLADGKSALLKKYNPLTNRINGRCDTLGAVSRRCTHSSPNLAQIPAGKKDKKGYLLGLEGGYGNEFRELFTVPKGYKLIGADASGLELRTLAHYLSYFDKGEYAKIVLEGDIHTKNQLDAGLPTRNNAKTFIYAFLYGAGDMKLGEIVSPNASADEKKKLGKNLKKKFMQSNPAIKSLITDIKARAGKRKYVLDLDGNRLYIRSEHSAPNLLLQSCGAIIMKYWLVEVDRVLQECGYENSDDVKHLDRDYDYEMVLNIHDEAQTEGKEDIAEEIARIKAEAFNVVGKELKLNIQIDGEADIGCSWKETH